jgi:hypothetical protein
MIHHIKTLILWPYYACQRYFLRQMILDRCDDLEVEGKDIVPSNVLTAEIIAQYLLTDYEQESLEKAIREDRWPEGAKWL